MQTTLPVTRSFKGKGCRATQWDGRPSRLVYVNSAGAGLLYTGTTFEHIALGDWIVVEPDCFPRVMSDARFKVFYEER